MYKIYYTNQEFINDNQAIAAAAYRLTEENPGTSHTEWLEDFGAEGITTHPLSNFDFSKTCDAVVPDETSYVIDCPNGSEEERFFYVGLVG